MGEQNKILFASSIDELIKKESGHRAQRAKTYRKKYFSLCPLWLMFFDCCFAWV